MTRKVGVTIGAKSLNEVWNCGIHANVINCYKLLDSIPDIEVDMLTIYDIKIEDMKDKHPVFDKMRIKYVAKHGHEYDMIIFMGGLPAMRHLEDLHNMRRVKLIYYKCGNDFTNVVEKILWDKDPKKEADKIFRFYDEVWYVPQQDQQNKHLYKMIFKHAKIVCVPFMWHPGLLDREVESFKERDRFKPYDVSKEKKIIGIMEPNISTLKFCFVPMLIAEHSYRGEGKEKIDHLKVTNAQRFIDNGQFKTFASHMDLQADNKLSVEHRYKTTYMLNDHVDVVVSHQQFNPMNYLYLDCVYMGYPVLHNGDLCKDIGYYYPGYDIDEGTRQLNKILHDHDKNHDEYVERNKKILWKYNIENPNIVKAYKSLIKGVYIGDNSDKIWDADTNLFK